MGTTSLIHIDIKKLGRIEGIGHRITGDRTGQSNARGIGREYLHVAIDDRSRLAFTQLLPTERQEDATAFRNSSLAWFNSHGVVVERVMTDNGSYQVSLMSTLPRSARLGMRAGLAGGGAQKREDTMGRGQRDMVSACKSRLFAAARARHGVVHKRTRPYTPKTNGKAERFIQSSIREWAYAKPFETSDQRQAAMHPWLHDDNTARPHAALGRKPPISRLTRDNLLGSDGWSVIRE